MHIIVKKSRRKNCLNFLRRTWAQSAKDKQETVNNIVWKESKRNDPLELEHAEQKAYTNSIQVDQEFGRKDSLELKAFYNNLKLKRCIYHMMLYHFE
jgi:hypothetical protein